MHHIVMCTIYDIILAVTTQGSVFHASTKSPKRNVRKVVGKPAEIRPIHVFFSCCSKNAVGVVRIVTFCEKKDKWCVTNVIEMKFITMPQQRKGLRIKKVYDILLQAGFESKIVKD